jgi:hypothetical protein
MLWGFLSLGFIVGGLFGLIVTLLAMRSNAYKALSAMYRPEPQPQLPVQVQLSGLGAAAD